MNKKRALQLAREWAQGHICTLQEGEAEEIRCGYDVDNADADEAFAELCNGYCANVGNLCYEEGEHYRCKHFRWRGPHKED